MSLSLSKSSLESAIKKAFLDINSKGSLDGASPESNISALASALSDAIHSYVTSADVDITSVDTVVPSGIAVSSPPAAPVTTSPGKAKHTGFGKLV